MAKVSLLKAKSENGFSKFGSVDMLLNRKHKTGRSSDFD